MNLGQLVDGVQLRCFTGQNLLEDTIKSELNLVVRDMARGVWTDERGANQVHYWSALNSLNTTVLATGLDYIDLTNCRAVLKVRISDGVTPYMALTERSVERQDIESPDTSQFSGLPSFFSMWGDRMLFDCKADVDYSVYTRMCVWPTDMVQDTDTPTLTGLDDAIVARCSANIFATRQGQDAAEAVYWLREGDRLYTRAVLADQSKKTVDGPIRFQPRFNQ